MIGGFLSPDGLRKSRFHDEKGNAVGLAALAFAPLAFLSAAIKRLTGHRPIRPMISYRAQADLARHLRVRTDAVVVEFGSGRSTPWLARRCARLVSFEDNPDWAATVRDLLARGGLNNVDYRVGGMDVFTDLSMLADGSVTLALVDGSGRQQCLRAILPKMAVGGVIYLDNSDKDMTDQRGDLRQADTLLMQAAGAMGWPYRYYTDFSPTNFFAEQGLWVDVTCPYESAAPGL